MPRMNSLKVLFLCKSLKKLLYGCKENTLKGKKVSKLYIYSIQLIMSEYEKKLDPLLHY